MIFLVVIAVSSSFMWKSVVHQPSLPRILSRKCKRLPGNIVYNAAFIARHLIYTRFIYFSKERKQITSACLTSSNCINAVRYSITLFRMLLILLKKKNNQLQKTKAKIHSPRQCNNWGYLAWLIQVPGMVEGSRKTLQQAKKCQVSPYKNIFFLTTSAACFTQWSWGDIPHVSVYLCW